MHHPFLYIHFEGLRAYIQQDELLAKVLAILNRILMIYRMIKSWQLIMCLVRVVVTVMKSPILCKEQIFRH